MRNGGGGRPLNAVVSLHRDTFVDEDTVARIETALRHSWSAETSVCFSPGAAPSYGQCAPTAVVIQERFGGEILRTGGWPPNGRHFYNRIDGIRYDFTADQFKMPGYSHSVVYDDIPSSASEAETEMLPGQLDTMRYAFRKAMNDAG